MDMILLPHSHDVSYADVFERTGSVTLSDSAPNMGNPDSSYKKPIDSCQKLQAKHRPLQL
jgi:hypothetical protein